MPDAFVDKKFNVKIFDSTGTTLKSTLNPDIIKNDISFASRINGGFGQLVIDVQRDFDNFDEGNDIDFMNIVEVYEIDTNNPTGRLIYTGFISAYEPYLRGSQQGVLLIVLGLGSLMKFAFYKSGGSFTVVHTSDDPQVIMKAIVDHFNTVYAGTLISYGAGNTTIDNVGTNVSYDFVERRWLDALQDTFVLVDPDWWWAIDKVGLVFLQQKPSSATHTFTVGKDLDEAKIQKSSEDVTNSVRIVWSSGNSDDSDAPSITNFGTRESIITDTDITDATSGAQRATLEVDNNKDEKIKATLKINSLYDIETIKVGDTCKIRNLNPNQTLFNDNMQIVSVKYSWQNVVLELEEINNSFGVQMDRFTTNQP